MTGGAVFTTAGVQFSMTDYIRIITGTVFLEVNNPTYPQNIDFNIDRNDSESAKGSVVKQTGPFYFNCLGATVTLKSQGKDKVRISFEGPTCMGSGVVSLADNKRLKGKIKIRGGYWTTAFSKSAQPLQ